MVKQFMIYLLISLGVVAPLWLLNAYIGQFEVWFPNFDPLPLMTVIFCTCLILHRLNKMEKD